jgi:uncharacterized protein (UPF0335 family)
MALDDYSSMVRRIQKLELRKIMIAAEINEFYAVAKAAGYDAGVLNVAVKSALRDLVETDE